jgi:hypothetical protein
LTTENSSTDLPGGSNSLPDSTGEPTCDGSSHDENSKKKYIQRNIMKEKGLRGSAKHCVHGLCRSDSRYPERCPDITWIPFAKRGRIKPEMSKAALFRAQFATERCKRWVHKCGRPNFTVENVKKDTYICSKHFVDGEPTIQNPDPVKATLSEIEVDQLTKRVKRRNVTLKKLSTPRKKKIIPIEVAQPVPEELLPPPDADLDSLNISDILPEDNQEGGDETMEYDDENYLVASRGCQTQYNGYVLGAKIETMMLRNEVKLMKEGNQIPSTKNDYGVYNFNNIVSDIENNCLYFTGLK